MKNALKLVAGIAASMLIACHAHAQSGGSSWSEVDVVEEIEFDDGPVIVGDPDNFRRTQQLLISADAATMDYINRSMESIEQGYRLAYTDFRQWYIERDAAKRKEAAQTATIAKIFSFGLSRGLDVMLPGSGVFLDVLKGGLKQAYSSLAASATSVPGGNVDVFLAAHDRTLEEIVSAVMAAGETFRDNHPEEWEMVKWEFVFHKLDSNDETAEMPAGAAKLLKELGVPPASERQRERIRLDVLEARILAVLEADKMFMIANGPSGSWTAIRAARLTAYRHVYRGKPEVYCPVEIDLYGMPSGMLDINSAGKECVNWKLAQDSR